MIIRVNEKKPKKKREAHAKYMINLTLTTEKQARMIDPRKPRMLKPKNAP